MVPRREAWSNCADGEAVKLHIGSGNVYLRDWINVDVPSPKTHLACDRPDLVERWETTDDDYYARHRDVSLKSLSAGPLDHEYVCDRFGNFMYLPVHPQSVEEVLCRHSFEHLSVTEARRALQAIHAVMTPGTSRRCGGLLRIDVPDHDETLRLHRETGNKVYERLILGPRKGDYGAHMMGYTREGLTTLVQEYGFRFVCEEPNVHEFYPAFCLRFESRQ